MVARLSGLAVALLTAGAAAVAAPAVAQVPLGASAPASAPASATDPPGPAAGLRPYLSHVRVLTADGVVVRGTLQRTGQDTLLLRPGHFNPATVPVPLAAVDSLWVRRSAWQRGGLIGSVVGVAYYVYVASSIDDHDPAAAALMLPTTAAEGVVFGLVIGGGLGTFVGSRIRRWPLHYARP
jgi:hypothetical protein